MEDWLKQPAGDPNNEWFFGDGSEFAKKIGTDRDASIEILEQLVGPAEDLEVSGQTVQSTLGYAIQDIGFSIGLPVGSSNDDGERKYPERNSEDVNGPLTKFPHINKSEIWHRMAAIQKCCLLIRAWESKKGDFQKLLSFATTEVPKNASDFMRALVRFSEIPGDHDAYWAAHDLLYFLREKRPFPAKRSATTPILLYEPEFMQLGKGHVAWLTVDLFEEGTGFVPDIASLGLTSLRQGQDADGQFFAAMRECWEHAGIDGRGRWTISAQPPHVDQPMPTQHFPFLHGRSAQAACLAAIWAANGQVPYPDKPFGGAGDDPGSTRTSMRLVSQVAISAQLPRVEASSDQAKSEDANCELEVLSVASPTAKVGGASACRLSTNSESLIDTVLFAEKESEDGGASEHQAEVMEEVKKAEDAEQQAINENQPFRGIRVRTIATMGDAMDLMLEVNRWMAAWHLYHQAEWLKEWATITETVEGKEIEMNTGSIEYMQLVEARQAAEAAEADADAAESSDG